MSRRGILAAGTIALVLAAAFYVAFGPDKALLSPPPRSPDGVGADSRAGAGPGRGDPDAAPPEQREFDPLGAVGRLLSGAPDAHHLRAVAKDPEALRAIHELVTAPGEPEVRAGALLLLALSGVEEAEEIIRSAVRGGFGEELRAAGILALGEAGGEWTVRALEDIRARSDSPSLRALAFRVLKRRDAGAALRLVTSELLSNADRASTWGLLLGAGPPLEGPVPGRIRRLVDELPVGFNAHEEIPEEDILPLVAAAEAEEDAEVRLVAAVGISRLFGDRAREGFFRIWERTEPAGQCMLLTMLDPAQAGKSIEEFIRRAPQIQDQAQRTAISMHLESLWAPDLQADLERWRSTEQNPEISARLTAAIERLSQK